MPIPFPKMHIAASVMNRVLNAMEDKASPLGFSAPEMAAPPVVTDPAVEGAAIEEATAAPPLPVAVPPGAEAAVDNGMLGESAMGGSPFDGALLSI